MTRRRFWAWLLLLAISIQWVGGAIYVRLSYTALIESEMNQAETELAEIVAQEYGVRTSVRILDEAAQESLLSTGYGAPFIFSHRDEDSTDYFTVERPSAEVVIYDYLLNGPERHQDADMALLSLNQLFSPYIINKAVTPKPVGAARHTAGNFAYQALQDLFYLSIPTPPPALVG